MRHAHRLLGLGVFTLILLFVIAPPIVQPQDYHAFAGPRMPNVVSNAAFAIVGVAGLLLMRGARFVNRQERWDAVVFFVGTVLISIGSTIYHLHPNDETLVWDRAGIVVAFMSFLAMILHERHDGAPWLLVALIALGVFSVYWWRVSGDLRLYGWVQFFPMLAGVVIVLLDEPRHSGEITALSIVLVVYVLAKIFELLDRSTYDLTGGLVSGHTLKHYLAAIGPLTVGVWCRLRGPLRAAQDPCELRYSR